MNKIVFFLLFLVVYIIPTSAGSAEDEFSFDKSMLKNIAADLKGVINALSQDDREEELKWKERLVKDLQKASKKAKKDNLLKYPDAFYSAKALAIDLKDKGLKRVGKGFVTNEFVDIGDKSRKYTYYVSIPKGYKVDLAKCYPVILYLRESTDVPDRKLIRTIKDELEAVFNDPEITNNAIILCPVGPNGRKKNTYVDASGDWEELDPGRKSAFVCIRIFLERMVFDRGRVFVYGNGRNGLSALRFATWYPSFFAGAIAVDAPLEPMFTENAGNTHFLYINTSENAADNAKQAAEWAKTFNSDERISISVVDDSGTARALTDTGKEAIRTIINREPKNTAPERVLLKALDLEFSSNNWLQIIDMNNSSTMKIGDENIPFVDATVNKEANSFIVKTNRVGQFTLYLNDKIIDMDKKITVMVNGKKRWEGTKERNLDLMLSMIYGNWAGDYEIYTNYIEVEDKNY